MTVRWPWGDQFDGRAGEPPDPRFWTAETGGGGWGCDQRQVYTADPDNACITPEHHLAITARRDGSGVITSARLITKDKITVRYGQVQARIKVPSGVGTWAAFWMLGDDIDQVGWPACGEIDVMEHVGSDPERVHGTLHAPGYAGVLGGIGATHHAGVDLSAEFHTYGVLWTAEAITWTLDGQAYQRLRPGDMPGHVWPFDHPFHLVLNLAIGGSWPGNDTPLPDLPATMLVDWIRLTSAVDSGGR